MMTRDGAFFGGALQCIWGVEKQIVVRSTCLRVTMLGVGDILREKKLWTANILSHLKIMDFKIFKTFHGNIKDFGTY